MSGPRTHNLTVAKPNLDRPCSLLSLHSETYLEYVCVGSVGKNFVAPKIRRLWSYEVKGSVLKHWPSRAACHVGPNNWDFNVHKNSTSFILFFFVYLLIRFVCSWATPMVLRDYS